MKKVELLTSIQSLSEIVNDQKLSASISETAISEMRSTLDNMLQTYIETYCK